jgi:DHA2 family multidrug resistance protein
VLVDRLGQLPTLEADAQLRLGARLHAQVTALTASDQYLLVAAIAVALIFLIPFVATRIHPPRALS